MILCNKHRGPKTLFSISLIIVPLLSVFAKKAKGERFRAMNFLEKHLDENLEWFPITRRAFNRALEVKKNDIKKLEEELARKQEELKKLQEI